MDAKQTLEQFRNKLEPLLDEYFDQVVPQAKNISPVAHSAVTYLKEYTLRKAKRLRAALMYYTYLMLRGKNSEEALRVSAFIEIIQSYLLIHDDVMDQDALRRGGATIHTIYADVHRQQYGMQDPVHFGESMAINLGDIACHLACDILTDSDFDAPLKVKALSKLHKQIVTVGYGQMLDVVGSVRKSVSEEDVFLVHEFKTATYTYETPISVGAILAGATDEDVKVLTDYAIPAGIAFQIQDDILGMFGDEEKLGKANTSDLREGKHTLLIIKALENGTPKQVKTITQALGNHNITQKDADKVRQIIRDTGSLEYSQEQTRKFVAQAKAALATRPEWQGEGREFLDGVADYMINREY